MFPFKIQNTPKYDWAILRSSDLMFGPILHKIDMNIVKNDISIINYPAMINGLASA